MIRIEVKDGCTKVVKDDSLGNPSIELGLAINGMVHYMQDYIGENYATDECELKIAECIWLTNVAIKSGIKNYLSRRRI